MLNKAATFRPMKALSARAGAALERHATRTVVAGDSTPSQPATRHIHSAPTLHSPSARAHLKRYTACYVQSPELEASPVSMGDVVTEDGSFVNGRNQKLVTKLYLPPKGTAVKGIYARHHGLGDYTARTHEGNERLARLGFAVWTFDAHGHGYSEPADELSRHTLLHFEHIIVDAEQFLQEVVQPWRDSQPDPVPLYISGPSLGGLVTMHVAGRGVVKGIDGVVLSCAAAGIVRTFIMRLQEPISGLLNILMPRAAIVHALEPERLCADPELIAVVKEDPLLPHGNVRVCTACAVLEGINQLPRIVPKITAPVMMIHGANDVTCSADTAKACLDSMSSTDKTWVLLPEAKHDLELDYWKEDWFNNVSQWLIRQADAWEPPSGTSNGAGSSAEPAEEATA